MENELKNATTLRKNKQFKKAIELYKVLWNENPNQFNEWDGWSYAYCLKNVQQFHEALDICRKIYPRFKNSDFINNLYAQCIYYTQIKTTPLPSIDTQRKAVKAMVQLSPPHQEYSFSGRAIFHLCKELMALKTIPWQEIETWLLTMDPDLLSQSTFKYKLPNGKTAEYASAQEQWYSIMIRVKGGLNQPDKLLAFIDEAKKRNIRWHYQNDIWMERKRAFAYAQLNQKGESEKILKGILRKKNEWFIYADLGDIVPHPDEKMKYYAIAANARGKLQMKVTLFEKIANLLSDKPELNNEYKKLLHLIVQIRKENGWSLGKELEQKIKIEKIEMSKENDALTIYNHLRPFWKKYIPPSISRIKGTIDFIHKNGKSGMIHTQTGEKFFFGMSGFINPSNKEIAPGTQVNFLLRDSFDKKKNKPSKIAVEIRFI